MILNDVHQGIKKNKARKRLGRGTGSGLGKTAGRGHKGAGSRAGNSSRLGFEGGQMPLARRVAKRGFSNNYFSTQVAIINLSDLDHAFEAGAVVDIEALTGAGFAKKKHDVIKILAKGDITKALTVKAHRFSHQAEAKIVAAGGKFEKIPE